MLKTLIVLRPQRAEVVCQKLVAAGWAEGLIAWESRGYGRQKEHLEQYGGHDGSIEFLPKVTIECLIEDAQRDELVQLVLSTCRTGRIGDGKIFFLPISAQVDIAST